MWCTSCLPWMRFSFTQYIQQPKKLTVILNSFLAFRNPAQPIKNCCLILTSKHFLKDSPSCLSISNTVVHITVIYCPAFSGSLPLAPAPWISSLGTRLWSYWSYVSPHVCGSHSHSLVLPGGIYPFLNACKPGSFYLPRLEQPRPPVPLVLLVYQMRPNAAHILLLVP